MLSEDSLNLPVSELWKRLRRGEFSPVELTERYLHRLERLGPRLGAAITVTRELALEQARQAEKEMSAGHWRGPLHGIPYGAKDLLATRAIPTTWGAPPYKDQVFDFDATVITKLREAGAILIAKLSMIELAGGGGYSNGKASLVPTLNPWDTTRWAGGSSSGSGAATAAALVGFAIGSETWGSILTPSSFCGVSGLRPTYGRVSRHGAMALSWTMDKLGPMCRTAEDCGLVLEAISGHDPEDPGSADAPFKHKAGEVWVTGPHIGAHQKDEPLGPLLRGLRIGWIKEDFEKNGQPEVEPLYTAALEVLRGLGADVREVKLPDFPYGTIAGQVISAEGATCFADLIRSGRVNELVDERQAKGLSGGLEVKAADYLRAMQIRRLIQRALAKVYNEADLLVSPSLLFVSNPMDADLNTVFRGGSGIGAAGNLCGLPGLGVNMGFVNGLPVGLTFVGRPFDEATVLRAGAVYQQATDWHARRPPIE
jgi:aspartyl-tRNA(Asn)/glutamyl-tRNA(Gln) amidotransferase subunit A